MARIVNGALLPAVLVSACVLHKGCAPDRDCSLDSVKKLKAKFTRIFVGTVVQQAPWYQSVVDTFWSILNGIAFLCAPHQLDQRSVLLSLQARCCLYSAGQEAV